MTWRKWVVQVIAGPGSPAAARRAGGALLLVLVHFSECVPAAGTCVPWPPALFCHNPGTGSTECARPVATRGRPASVPDFRSLRVSSPPAANSHFHLGGWLTACNDEEPNTEHTCYYEMVSTHIVTATVPNLCPSRSLTHSTLFTLSLQSFMAKTQQFRSICALSGELAPHSY